MVENAITQCRRDLLWQRMLITTNMAEEEGRRKRRSERVDPDQEKDTVCTRLHTVSINYIIFSFQFVANEFIYICNIFN